MNVTETVCAALTSMTQLSPDTLLQPNHPPKSEKVVGIAVSVTCVPRRKDALHGFPDVAAQLSPGGLLVTAPVPAPVRTTLSCTDVGSLVNFAVTSFVTFDRSTTQFVPATESHPLQLAKLDPAD